LNKIPSSELWVYGRGLLRCVSIQHIVGWLCNLVRWDGTSEKKKSGTHVYV